MDERQTGNATTSPKVTTAPALPFKQGETVRRVKRLLRAQGDKAPPSRCLQKPPSAAFLGGLLQEDEGEMTRPGGYLLQIELKLRFGQLVYSSLQPD